MAETAPPLLIKNKMIMAAHCRRRTQGCSGTTRNRERINLAELALKKYLSIEGALPVDSKSGCETMNDRDYELFWIEKFIYSPVNSVRVPVPPSTVGALIGGHHMVTRPRGVPKL
jgi:hypothetical protein